MADSETDSTKECDDCGNPFPLRQASGKCAKCIKLSGHTRDSAEYQDIFSWPQCLLCGITRRNMAPPTDGLIQTCGTATCNLVARTLGSSVPSESGPVMNGLGPLVANAANEADKARLQATRHRLKLPPANSNSKNPVPGTRLTTGTLLAHEHGGGLPGDTLIMVCWGVRSSKNSKLDARLGSASKKWSTNLFLNDIKSDIVQAVNIEWTQQTLVPLEDDETSFRWSDNRLLDRNTSTMTLGEFYTYHSTPSNAPIYLHDVPKKWKHFLKTAKNAPFICLELYIHYDAWLQRKEAIENQEMPPSTSQIYSSKTDDVTSRKRGRTESSKNVVAPKNKQIRPLAGSGILSSEFSRSGRSGRTAVQTQSPITFKKITCITAVQTGDPTLIDTGDIFRGYIFDKPFSSGTMKQAFDLILENGEQYVAKRFYKLAVPENDFAADSEVEVSVGANRIEIEGEIERLAIGKWMLDAFYRHCRSRKDISVDTNIAFTDAFLAVEVDRPSIASGVHLITEDNDGLTWLVERKRPSTVTKFSGTLVHHSHRRDLRSATIFAFAHFVFGYSKRTLVVADLQGTPCLVRNNEGLILFDLMTHTVDGDSGVGDFGRKGIKTFVDDHNCTDLCRSLSLDTNYPLVMPKDGEEDDSLEGEKRDSSDSDSDEVLQVHT